MQIPASWRWSNGSSNKSPSSASHVLEPAEDDPNLKLPHRNTTVDYLHGDVYDAQPTAVELEWEINTSEMPYLKHIKTSSLAWPHLRYLAQWMEVTTSPVKWQLIRDHPNLAEIRAERARRTKVAAVDFVPDQPEPGVREITDAGELAQSLDAPPPRGISRLYIVEDLSRDVVETLGARLDIDPLFFREHINDYLWYNVQDPWVELPDLDIVSRARRYFRLMYVQPRYFKNPQSLKKAQLQAGNFNVLRRLDDDRAHASLFDQDGGTVALVRSKVSLWLRPAAEGQGTVGVLLIDPSITEGYPLWNGYRPFQTSPPPSDRTVYTAQPRTKLYDDVLFWINKMSQEDINAAKDNPMAMAFRISQIICAEWLTLGRYITARLGQIEWEIERPDFRLNSNYFNESLTKLHTWRRRLPLYKDMVGDTRKKLFPPVPPSPSDSSSSSTPTPKAKKDCMDALRADFAIVAGHIDDLLSRTERIAAVATAVTAIEESRRAVEQNKALGRLTYLAVIFAPLSFISSFFSMSENVADLSNTFWIYFAVAIPVSLVVFLVVDLNWTDSLKAFFDRTGVKGRVGVKGRGPGGGAGGRKKR
ncbi:hypothetical protein F5B20DRAFT_537383 [Whalleya microplaca]|nr:hypothetical protein F5B20DRAFT_537383 [Whalleya microplaca]